MADVKISGLPSSTTPLAGSEVLPIVQSGATKQVSIANLTAGRAISATQMTLTTGNLIVASGKGVDFSATAGTGTSELLADYEEGAFTPTITAATGTLTSYTTACYYTKVGNVVTLIINFQITDYGTGSGVLLLTVPFGPFVGTAGNIYAYGGGQEVVMVGTRLYLDIAGGSLYVTGIAGAPAAVSNSRFTGSVTYISV